jgi:hypothetical protein
VVINEDGGVDEVFKKLLPLKEPEAIENNRFKNKDLKYTQCKHVR